MARRWIALLFGAFVFALAIPSAAVPDPDDDIVYVRTTCPQGQQDCFQGTQGIQFATTWAEMRSSGPPENDPPLLIDIGPGVFGPFFCDELGNTTLRGVGVESRGGSFTKVTTGGIFNFVVAGGDCRNVTFQSMTIGDGSDDQYSLAWRASGDTVWEDVELQGRTWTWFDRCINNDSAGLHYFFDSTATTTEMNTEGFRVACSELWWYGGGIRVTSKLSVAPVESNLTGVLVAGNGDLRVIGSKIHVVADWGPSVSLDSIVGVRVQQSGGTDASIGTVAPDFPSGHGSFHLHGSTLVVDARAMANSSVVGIQVSEEGHAHTPGAVFDLIPPSSGNGSARRVALVDLELTGHADSPYTWPDRTLPPTGLVELYEGFGSIGEGSDGFDLWTETDCDPLGRCPAPVSSSESHLMVYEPSLCTGVGNPWLNATTGRCRNDAGP